MLLECLLVLFAMTLTAVSGAKWSRPQTYQARVVELVFVSATFLVGWAFQSRLGSFDPVRASALIVASYSLARVGLDRDCGARHLTPCLALTMGALVDGSISLAQCLLPVVVGHVVLNSARWVAFTSFVALAPAALVVAAQR